MKNPARGRVAQCVAALLITLALERGPSLDVWSFRDELLVVIGDLEMHQPPVAASARRRAARLVTLPMVAW